MPTVENLHAQLLDDPMGSALHPSSILIVDDEVVVREILARKLESMGYACECCADGRRAVDLLASRQFDLVLADLLMPEISGIALLKQATKISPGIAVIFVTSVVDIDVAVDALKHGAYDYITKPFSVEQVSISVSQALEKRRLLLANQNYQHTLEDQVARRTGQLQEALEMLEHTYHSTLVALSKALDSREANSDEHSLRVTVYTRQLAQRLKLPESEIRAIEQGVLLHDIGKIGIPDELLSNPANLTGREWLLMRKHPEIGYRILSNIKFLHGAAEIVLHHHEYYDGNGYPQGLKADEIHLGARIFAVTNALDDLTSNCRSHPAISFKAAAVEIEKMSGIELDPQIVGGFLDIPLSAWKRLRREIDLSSNRTDLLRPGTVRSYGLSV
jgi:response regulator RpfG family c-di-GMP phosphodiesterase